ncbi:MAG: GntR family transcriptional regulator [Deltaproteobacteria bacterium]|nr:GntR family transcriptional regulator [Deltaproteobacteria bacterium]MBT4265141.1 GntR family transcriptional regulator [Deltaproteobacteria bacterium]MBT4641427.1 GntR family transcriptional regulator [Deltaproteobacteria bacterium]MBT6500310.1 GntR family transcriptional regulator [Deltaproteobacteria bacterium]MBT6614921.1 GntR family transcriptional regulator [Deltaproteobacteria bacterium]
MTEIAVHELRKAIMRGDLAAGTRLIPAKLEEELGLSKTAIREAIRELVGTGLADSNTHRGAYVGNPLALAEIREIFKFRYELEGHAAYLGCEMISDKDLKRMNELNQTVEKSDDLLPWDSFFSNQEFHMILYCSSGWQYLTKVIYRIYDQVLAFRGYQYGQLEGLTSTKLVNRSSYQPFHDDHVEIVEAITNKKPAQTRKLIVSNLKRGLKSIEDMAEYLAKN